MLAGEKVDKTQYKCYAKGRVQWNHRESMLIGMMVVEWKDTLDIMTIKPGEGGEKLRE